MLRLVRLAMPNIVRNRIFTEYAMETTKDSIKYMKPVFSKTQSGKSLNGKATDPDANNDDPWGYDDSNARDDNAYDSNARKMHKGLYESTEDRYVQELWNATLKDGTGYVYTDARGSVGGGDSDDPDAFNAAKTKEFAANATLRFSDKPFATLKDNGDADKYTKLLDGYSVIYFGDETHPIAVQDKVSKKFAIISDWANMVSFDTTAGGKLVRMDENGDASTAATTTNPFGIKLLLTKPVQGTEDEKFFKEVLADLENKGITPQFRAYARYDSEDDFVGDYLGEVQLKIWEHKFEPRPTTIGVTWSQLSQIVLDTSYSVNIETELVTYAAQEIRVALDYKAIRLAYQKALTNDKAYVVQFNADVGSTDKGINNFGYKQNAQTFASAVAAVEDVMLNDINCGFIPMSVAA